MPIYEYRCPECGHRFEKLVRMGADAPPCPECAHAEVTKLVSASGFILKGGGWYKDHYGLKSGGASKDAGASSSSSSDGGSSSTSSSDSGGSSSGSSSSSGGAGADA